MQRIEDPFALRSCLERFSAQSLTPVQARMVLAARGIRTTRKALEQALRFKEQAVAGASAPRRVRLKPLDDLPLTPEERAIMERLRQGKG